MEYVSILSLWLPILVSAVLVFAVSSVIHMFTSIHKNDLVNLPDEDGVRNALRPFNIPPGDFFFPRTADHKEMDAPEFKAKLKEGPVGLLTVYPNEEFQMGSSLVQWFIYCVVVSIFAAYLTGRALDAGTAYLTVFQFAGTTAFLGYALALVQNSIWWRRNWVTTGKSILDGLLYGLVTAGTFGWLWPA